MNSSMIYKRNKYYNCICHLQVRFTSLVENDERREQRLQRSRAFDGFQSGTIS